MVATVAPLAHAPGVANRTISPVGLLDAAANASVADYSPTMAKAQESIKLAIALLGGTEAMRKAGETYLPRWPNEGIGAWDNRLKTATLFPAYKRTVETLTGKPFSKPITIEDDVPQAIQDLLEDIDMQGRNVTAFASDILEGALGRGLCGILVDFPKADQPVVTKAQEAAAGLRPYWVQVNHEQILGWKAKVVDGEWKFTQLRIKETVQEPVGEWGEKDVEQVRVLEPGRFRVYRKETQNNESQWNVHDEGITTLDYVPFFPVYGERKSFMVARPPLIELGYLNVKHWQSQSDQDNLMHVARVPILCVVGAPNTLSPAGDPVPFEVEIGASSAVSLPENASMEYVEHTGAAIDSGKTSLDDLKEEMRQAGAELLVIKPGQITATQTATENAVGMCALQRITLNLEDVLETALQCTADWMALPEGGSVKVFNDFGAATLAEASADLLLKANQAGKISDETLHTEYQRRGILSGDITWEEEQERLDAQGPAIGSLGIDPLTGMPKDPTRIVPGVNDQPPPKNGDEE